MSNELIDSMFDENGDLSDWVYEKMRTEGVLEGIEAVAWLAGDLAGETHGNYSAKTLFRRSGLSKYYNIRVESKKRNAPATESETTK